MKRFSATAALCALLFLATPAQAAEAPCPDARQAQAGNAQAQYAMGQALAAGQCGMAADKAAAAAWYRKAAEQGDTLAAYALGEMHFTGGTDYPEAKRWFLKAAQKDAGDARFRLGNFYANYKTPRDYPKAFRWLKRAAEGGHRTAMFDLARLYKQGKGTEKNDAAALHWTQKAAEAGVTQAMLSLVEMYENGTDVPKNPLMAAKWTMKLAAEPSASVFALNRAGDLLFDGTSGMPRNYPAARKYYERAALKDDAHAKARLAKMYAEGLGVMKDAKKAREYGR